MLDLVSVLTKGGIVLWSKVLASATSTSTSLRSSTAAPAPFQRSGSSTFNLGAGTGASHPVDALIREVLVEERAGLTHFDKDSYRVQWAFANDLDLIFVVAYQKILQLTYIDELLELIKKAFCDMFGDIVRDTTELHTYDFEETFETILFELEARETLERKNRGPRSFKESKKYATTLAGSKESPDGKQAEEEESAAVADISAKLKKLQMRGRKSQSSNSSKPSSPKLDDEPRKSRKVLRAWDGAVAIDGGKQLDFSESKDSKEIVAEHLVDRSSMGTRTADGLYDAPEMDDVPSDDESEDDTPAARTRSKVASKSSTGGVFSFFQSLTGQKTLKAEHLAPVLAKMKEHLVSKNVAAEIAETLADSVSASLIGQKQGSFSSLSNIVKSSMETALKRILTPRTSTDVLRDVLAAKSAGRPYVFVFVGVNGVGKSTNLSKVCFWLLQNKLRVLIAACDTFRSGAVEQLRVHARNLKALENDAVVELYERGYGKDSANIAKDAIVHAKQNNFDVVLVDTAGRMQDNEPLMRALAKLVSLNNPDKIIFVGEALVGNEAVDQLSKFNQALLDFSGQSSPRQVDGIILSKFDTVDDKVGAALSMTYVTGQPILFVGTGQTYTDLRKMNVKSIVTTLLA
ncbi:hypothetical protein HDV05_004287 [Chytridiales sp. JEL 0842]|nr:hypothetical protein HDV05_004287 [Chytridiales sp. JEL 0842]